MQEICKQHEDVATGAHHPTPDREGNPNTPLVTITWVGVPHANCKQT